MPRTLRLPTGPQRLALAEGHGAALTHPDFAPQARRAESRFEPGFAERLAALPGATAEMIAGVLNGGAVEQDGWAPQVPEWADGGERTAHGYTLVENIALIDVEGLLMARGFTGWWSDRYWPGYRDYVAAIEAANADERVDALLIRFDTPGGYVSGCAEAARAIRAMRSQNGGKPLVGHASELCASAGMKLAAQCDVFYASDGAIIGSVGVRIGFFDFGGALEKWGERYHLYKSGEFKDMGSPLRAPTEAEAKLYQAEVDHFADRFYVELAAGRDMDLEAVRESRGWEARTFTAGDPPPPVELDPMAVDLIDGVMGEESAFQIAQALAPKTVSASKAVASRAAPERGSIAAAETETPMLKAKAAALKARADKGDEKAKAELAELLAALGAKAEGDDDAEGEGEDDDADAENSGDDDADSMDEDDDADAVDEDDDAAAEDEDDDAEAVINHPSAKGREKLASQLSLKVVRGKMSKADAIGLLDAAPKGESSFRKKAAANTPSGVRAAGAGSGKGGKDEAQAALSDAHKRAARFRT